MKKISKKKIIFCSVIFLMLILITIIMLIDKEMVIDEAIYNFIFNCRCKFLDNYFTFVTHFGDTLFILGFVLLFALVCRNINGLFLLISTGNSAILTLIFKQIFLRTRPEHLRLIEQGGYSFPSGHAMVSVCVYGYLLALALQIKNKVLKYIVVSLLFILIVSIGISRIYVGVHYPTDVIAGYLLGTIEVVLLMDVLHIYKTRGI